VYSEPLDQVPLWGFFAVACAATWLALEGGYRLGRWRHAHPPDEKEGPVGAMVGSVLGLLAFMLGFTFGLAAARFDARRQVVLDEANAIGTTYLRARLLPEPQRTEVVQLLRELVDVRLPAGQYSDSDQVVAQAVTRSEELHERLWARAAAVAEKTPTPITAHFIQSLNEVIDLHAKRVMLGLRSRIPLSIWIGLFGVAILGMASTGYQVGLAGTRRSPAAIAFVLAFAAVLLLVADLDRPGEGLLRTSQEAMVDLQRSMRAGTP
jgi:hypothetical protein